MFFYDHFHQESRKKLVWLVGKRRSEVPGCGVKVFSGQKFCVLVPLWLPSLNQGSGRCTASEKVIGFSFITWCHVFTSTLFIKGFEEFHWVSLPQWLYSSSAAPGESHLPSRSWQP
jgi:hypothetical protein